MSLWDEIKGIPITRSLSALKRICDAIDADGGGGGGGVDVSSFATAGDGSEGNPWTGMFDALTFQDHTGYFYRAGHYAYDTSPNFYRTGISHIGEASVFLHHTGSGDGFIMEADEFAVVWLQRARFENLTILGHVTTLSGSGTATSGTNTLTGTGTLFLSEVSVGDAIAFESGTANNETRIVASVIDNTHLTIQDTWTTNKSGAAMKCGKTRNGFRMSGLRNTMLKNMTAHDVGHAGFLSEWCVTNMMEFPVVSYHDPTQFTEHQVRAQWGILLDINSTTWTIIEPVMEGLQSAGIWTRDGSYNATIINGTCEGNPGKGGIFQTIGNVIINTDFEANQDWDIEVLQSRNTFINCLAASKMVVSAGQGARIQAGTIGDLVVDGDYLVLDGVEVNGTITGVGKPTMINTPYINLLDGSLRPDARLGNVIDWVKELTPGSTVNTDARQGRINVFTSTGNFTLANPTNGVNGQAVTWRITQSASHTITYDTKFRAAPGKELPPMPAAGEILIVTFRYHSTDDKWDLAESNLDLFSTFQASDISAQDINAAGAFYVDDMQVLTNQQPAITNPTGGSVIDVEARTALISLLDANRAHGLIGVTAPFNLANTVFYSEAQFLTYENGAKVRKWRERSGNGRHLAQSDPTKQPLFITSAIDGKPCVRFDGVNDSLISGAWSYSQPICVSMVIKRYNNAFKYLYSSIDTYGVAMFQGDGSTDDKVSLYAGTGSGDPNGAIDSGVWYLVTAEYNGSSSKIYENGVQVGSTGNPGTSNGNGFVLGNRWDFSLPCQIDVAAVVIYLTSERSNVETYLLDEYPSL